MKPPPEPPGDHAPTERRPSSATTPIAARRTKDGQDRSTAIRSEAKEGQFDPAARGRASLCSAR
ncbi:unnamed protein product [Chondrus crispus]|uniref:Uncharacterized protein n=1 Tax=Chondrus crispus TaxID=2769 RepID=R7QDA5_CHOCR|nr:unnamed protein product [Chondrus crispus]CDF36472.1 unnamed protein product [Chondrus crispus]|eukprot:XP_005716291.1 unnamed protein product [Chondrus crispus]